MDNDGVLFLLALGPASAAGLYWMLYRYYRNTDKSHAFERETAVEVKEIHGEESDRKIDEIRRTQERRIRGDNLSAYRRRVDRVRLDPGDRGSG